MNMIKSTALNRIIFNLGPKLLKNTLLVFLLACFYSASALSNQPYKPGYTLGVFPHLPPRQLEKVFAPIAARLGKAIGRKVKLRSSSTYEKFMENLDGGSYDIVFVQPFDYIHIADSMNYKPLATRNELLAAILVVAKDSPIKNLEQLRNKKIAFPPKVSAVSRLTMGFLKKNKFSPGKDVSISHHRSHVSCMQQVLIGTADACATAAPALRFFQHKMKVELKIVAKSISIPHTLFATHPRVSDKDRQVMLTIILSLQKSEEGRKILAQGKLKPFVVISDEKYNVVRKLDK